MMRNPSGSLPAQMGSPRQLKAAYRLVEEDEKAVSFAALSQTHWRRTRQACTQEPFVLMVQDTTELDFTFHAGMSGLGPIGNGKGRGLLLQSVLALCPTPRRVLGLAWQEPFLRRPRPAGLCSE